MNPKKQVNKKKQVNPSLKRLGKSLFDRTQSKSKPYALVLGAGASVNSNCPTWGTLCKDYCEEYSVKCADGDYIAAFKSHLKSHQKNKIDIFLAFSRKLRSVEPSIGYMHLANLISKGAFQTIITTNFDNLLEKALSKIVPIDDIKVLIRGEVTDEYMSDFVEKGVPKIKIIKLHGDLQSNIFFFQDEDIANLPPTLQATLQKIIKTGSVLLGSGMNDNDLFNLYSGAGAYTVYVNPEQPQPHVKTALDLNEDRILSGDSGKFDYFCTELDLEFQRHLVRGKAQERKEIERTILEKQEKGAGYINYDQLGKMVEAFWSKIKIAYSDNLDAIIFINDPTAPGGMELKRRMKEYIERDRKKVLIDTVKIEGQGSRYYKRRVVSTKPVFAFEDEASSKNILILDAISFSGNTMRIAISKFKEWFPNNSIRGGILVIDDELQKNLKIDPNLKDLIFYKTTDRYEIFFPWGVTQATSECRRELRGLEETYPVIISKRPWGTIEVLVQQQSCSVRLLTIEANEKLSFQRHLVRDEFFISLDANIGLEICSDLLEDVSQSTSISDIPSIKSLVLEKGDYVLIPKGIWHRCKASKERVRLLEIGYGAYDQDKDIERIDDTFGRKNLDGSE